MFFSVCRLFFERLQVLQMTLGLLMIQVLFVSYFTHKNYIPPVMSSPHPAGNPVLFADGHVQNIAHDWLIPNQNQAWKWQNTISLSLPLQAGLAFDGLETIKQQ